MALFSALGTLGRSLRLLTPSLPSASSAAPLGQPLAASLAERWRAVQARGIISVDVPRDNVDSSLKQLFATMKQEGYERRALARVRHTGKAEQRKLDKKETAHRLKKREYRRLMRWVMTRKIRGF